MAQKPVTLDELLNRLDGDLAHQLRLLKEAAEQQVIEDRALARRVAEYLLPDKVNLLAQKDPRALDRMTTGDFLRLIQQSMAPQQMLFDIADSAHSDPALLLRTISAQRDKALADLAAANALNQDLQQQLVAARAAASQPARRSAGSASKTAASTLPLPLNAPAEETPLEDFLARIYGGEHREVILKTPDASLFEQALAQKLITRMEITSPSPSAVIDLSAAGKDLLVEHGITEPANLQLSSLQSRGLSMNIIYAVLWAAAALGDIDVAPSYLGDLQPTFVFQGKPVVAADVQPFPTATQLLNALKSTGGYLWLLTVNKNARDALNTQVGLAKDEYLESVRRPVTICQTTTLSLEKGSRHTDGSIWTHQQTFPVREGAKP